MTVDDNSGAAGNGDGVPALRRLVVAHDDSPGANAAAAFALWLGAASGARVTLIHAGPTPETAPSADLLPAAAEQVVEYEAGWRRRLEAICDASPAGVDVDYLLERGQAAGAVISAAIERKADIVLMGSRGAGRVRGAVLGSVSMQVLSHAPCSVMIFHHRDPAPPPTESRSVIVGVDGSPHALHAVRVAQQLAQPLQAKLVLLHAFDPTAPFATRPTKLMRDLVREHGHTVVADARSTVSGIETVVEEIVEGHPVQELLAACGRHDPAILVLGSRGLGGFKELLLGSTARAVANEAQVPVLVTRGTLAVP